MAAVTFGFENGFNVDVHQQHTKVWLQKATLQSGRPVSVG